MTNSIKDVPSIILEEEEDNPGLRAKLTKYDYNPKTDDYDDTELLSGSLVDIYNKVNQIPENKHWNLRVSVSYNPDAPYWAYESFGPYGFSEENDVSVDEWLEEIEG
jgi:hypothetical protein